MTSPNRRTVFVGDNSLEYDVRTLERTQPRRGASVSTTSIAEVKPSAKRRFPVKPTPERRLVPQFHGSPWNHYENRYAVKYGTLFGIITSRGTSSKQRMIRTISGADSAEQIDNILELCHENIVQSIEIYPGPDSSYFLISEYMATSLMHLCRAPLYPNEPQLSSILYQVLKGIEFLLNQNAVHEKLSCSGILIDFKGNVKIYDIEHCKQSGDVTNPTVKQLLAHDFMQKKDQEELVWLVPLVLISAYHSRE
ncbi:hypothetical protein PG987_004234 [Apiospora arundinis]